jgi:hypothetical protein
MSHWHLALLLSIRFEFRPHICYVGAVPLEPLSFLPPKTQLTKQPKTTNKTSIWAFSCVMGDVALEKW